MRSEMLKSYEAIYEDGRLKWLGDRPAAKRLKVIVTVLEEESDIDDAAMRKILFEQAKGCVPPEKSIEEIDADIREMRSEWERDWDR
jgi:hypothetical protein